MPARLAFSWIYERLLDVNGAHADIDRRLEIDARLGDGEARHELNRREMALLEAAGAEFA